MSAPREGWGWPAASRKAHYVRNGMSLCGRWMFTGPLDQGGLDSPSSTDDCAACTRRVAKELGR